jgi:hypothetical protein
VAQHPRPSRRPVGSHAVHAHGLRRVVLVGGLAAGPAPAHEVRGHRLWCHLLVVDSSSCLGHGKPLPVGRRRRRRDCPGLGCGGRRYILPPSSSSGTVKFLRECRRPGGGRQETGGAAAGLTALLTKTRPAMATPQLWAEKGQQVTGSGRQYPPDLARPADVGGGKLVQGAVMCDSPPNGVQKPLNDVVSPGPMPLCAQRQ